MDSIRSNDLMFNGTLNGDIVAQADLLWASADIHGEVKLDPKTFRQSSWELLQRRYL